MTNWENHRLIINRTSILEYKIELYDIELAIDRATSEARTVTTKIASIAVSLLQQSGLWELGNKASEDYNMFIQKTLHHNYEGLSHNRMEMIRIITSGTTIISTHLISKVPGDVQCSNQLILKTIISPILVPLWDVIIQCPIKNSILREFF